MGAVVYPHSIIPLTAGKVWMGIIVGQSGGSAYDYGIQVMASLDGNATVCLRFDPGPTLPSGTPKLRLLAQANAASGDAKINPKWASVAAGEDPSAMTLGDEGVSTLSWTTGNYYKYKELKITLDADTIVAGEIIAMNLIFATSSWTLAQVSIWSVSIVWE